jgi:branched-chain amino acid transport system substrate-binding protein
MKLSKVLVFVMVASLLLSACAGAGSTPIKVGVLAPLTGQNPTFGQSTQEGALLAIKEWNAKGGVLGKQIQAVVADSQCSADPAVNAANKLIDQDKVKYIVGEVCSSASIPVSEIVNQKHVVQISPTSTNANVTIDASGVAKPYTFRACFIDPFQGLVMAKFAMSKGYKTAFIMFDQGNDYVRGLAEAFQTSFEANGGTIVGKESYTSTDTDFSAILTKVADSKAEVLYLPDYYPIVNLVGAQAKDKGVTAVMMGGDGWDSSKLDVKASDGGFYSNHYDPSDTRQIVVDWLAKYGAEYKENGQPKVPDALATLAYDATNILLASIQKAGADDPVKVKDAMAGISWDGVSGKVTFDAQHNPIKSAAVIGVKDGQKKYVETINP